MAVIRPASCLRPRSIVRRAPICARWPVSIGRHPTAVGRICLGITVGRHALITVVETVCPPMASPCPQYRVEPYEQLIRRPGLRLPRQHRVIGQADDSLFRLAQALGLMRNLARLHWAGLKPPPAQLTQ